MPRWSDGIFREIVRNVKNFHTRAKKEIQIIFKQKKNANNFVRRSSTLAPSGKRRGTRPGAQNFATKIPEADATPDFFVTLGTDRTRQFVADRVKKIKLKILN